MFIQRQADRISEVYHDYPAAFWRLVGVTFVDRLGGSLLYPFFALYITSRFGVGMTQVGVLFSLFFLSSFVGSMIGGAMTDRLGRRSMVIFSLLTTSISSVAMGLVGSLNAFFVVALIGGVFNEVGGPAYQAMVADLLPSEKRAQGYGVIRVAFNLAVAIGPAIGGFLAARSYLLLFVSDAVISSITAGLVYFTLPETKPAAVEGAPAESLTDTFRGYLTVLRDAAFMGFLGASILMGFVYMNMGTTLGVYLRDVHGVAESGYGLILSLNAAMVVVLQFPITRRIEGLPPMLVMAAGTFLYAIGFGLYGLVASFALFLVAIAIVTLGEMLVAPVGQAVSATLAPEDMRGRYMSIFGLSFGIPFAVGPLLAGLILDNLNPNLLWLAAFLLGTISAGIFLILHRKIQIVEAAPSYETLPPA